jgi:RNA polymerase sigma-70 factor (ECF subfamily)
MTNPSPAARTYHSRTEESSLIDDIAIVRRITECDESALAMLYDRWVQRVYSLVVDMLHDTDEAEDVVEETFWQVWQRASSYDPAHGTVATWLLTMTRSRALDRMRAKQRRRGESLADRVDAMQTIDAADPSLDAEDADRRAAVLQALQALPDEQRGALELAYFGGLNQTEIAEYLTEPLGTVKTRMRLGLRTLREELGTFRGEGA